MKSQTGTGTKGKRQTPDERQFGQRFGFTYKGVQFRIERRRRVYGYMPDGVKWEIFATLHDSKFAERVFHGYASQDIPARGACWWAAEGVETHAHAFPNLRACLDAVAARMFRAAAA